MNPLSDEVRELSRTLAAEFLRRGAVKVNLDTPFRLASGNRSPIYVNCRQLISYRETLHLIVAAATLQLELHECTFSAVAGGETAGIPFAAFLATALNKPMVYVRKGVKGHGLATAVEGSIEPGSRVLLIEDLITDGLSKLDFIASLRKAGSLVADALVLLDRLQGGGALLAENGVRLLALTDLETVLQVMSDWTLISPETVTAIRAYLRSPADWHAARELPYSPAGEMT